MGALFECSLLILSATRELGWTKSLARMVSNQVDYVEHEFQLYAIFM